MSTTIATTSKRILAQTISRSRVYRNAHLNPSAKFSSSAGREQQFLNADSATFETVTAKDRTKDRLVLVDFYADWCGPCKILSPVLEKLTEESADTKTGSGLEVDLVTIDVDAETELAQRFNIRSVPTVLAFKDGEAVKGFVGAVNKPGIEKFLQEL